jgi:hypothetical protein
MTSTDFVALLLEDAAAVSGFQSPFDPLALPAPMDPRKLPVPLTESWLAALSVMDLSSPGPEYILDQARLLGLPTRLSRSDLHVVKPHQKVLELPGTGGQLAHHLVSTQGDLTLQDNVTVACGTWQESVLAGVAALDLSAPHTRFALPVDPRSLSNPETSLRKRREDFDFVVGLHPDKGGLFKIEDQLSIWFPTARYTLV